MLIVGTNTIDFAYTKEIKIVKKWNIIKNSKTALEFFRRQHMLLQVYR